jgi:hypothetical protein
MESFEAVLKLYKYVAESEEEVERELKKLGEIIKTRSQLNKDVEYISVTKVSRGDVKGLIIIRGDRGKVLDEVNLLTTLIRTNFKSIDVEVPKAGLLSSIALHIKNFL